MSILRECRMKAGLSAYELANRAGTLEMRVYAFERQRFNPHQDEAERLATVLGTMPEKLFPDAEWSK